MLGNRANAGNVYANANYRVSFETLCANAAFKFKEEGGKPPCDFWGVNYYTRGVVTGYGAPAKMDGMLCCVSHHIHAPKL